MGSLIPCPLLVLYFLQCSRWDAPRSKYNLHSSLVLEGSINVRPAAPSCPTDRRSRAFGMAMSGDGFATPSESACLVSPMEKFLQLPTASLARLALKEVPRTHRVTHSE
jgi:hypothetical protein